MNKWHILVKTVPISLPDNLNISVISRSAIDIARHWFVYSYFFVSLVLIRSKAL